MSDLWRERLARLGSDDLTRYLCRQGWFRCEVPELSGVEVVAAQALTDSEPALLSVLVEARHRTGLSDVYQLVVVAALEDAADAARVVGRTEGWTFSDALADPPACAALMRVILGGTGSADADLEHIGSETGSSSVRMGDIVLKVYRELRPGPNVELEWLRMLRDADFPHVPALRGWLDSDGQRLPTTLAIVQDHLRDAVPGPTYLRGLAGDRAALGAAAEELGAVIAALHEVEVETVGTFAPDPASSASAAMLLAAIEDELDGAVQALPPDASGDDISAAAMARERVHTLSGGPLGAFVRTHGDLRLRHALHTKDGWKLVGFQGDLEVPAGERRRRRPGLWDVACARTSLGRIAEDVGGDPEPWQHACSELSRAYRRSIDPALVPPSPDVASTLTGLLELARVAQLVRRTSSEPDDQRRWIATLRDLANDSRTLR